METMEFTGVLYLGLSRANPEGLRLSHPATMGMRDVAVKSTLELAMVRALAASTANGTRIATAPDEPRPMRNAWGMGPTRSIWSGGTSAWTADVPRMNMIAITGAAMRTERPIVRRASRASPASTATYSNPESAPTASLPKTLRLKSVSAGAVMASG